MEENNTPKPEPTSVDAPGSGAAEKIEVKTTPPQAKPAAAEQAPEVEVKTEPSAPAKAVPVTTEPELKAAPEANASAEQAETSPSTAPTPMTKPEEPVDKPSETAAKQTPEINNSPAINQPEAVKPTAGTPAATHPHHNNAKLGIIVTIIAALLLSAVAVFVYMSTNDNAEEADESVVDTQQVESLPVNEDSSEPATEDTVDETLQEIDETIDSIDEEESFNEEDTSDTTLGL